MTKLTQKYDLYKGMVLPPAAIEAFKALKHALTMNPVVAFPHSDREFALIVDASTGTDTVKRRNGGNFCTG